MNLYCQFARLVSDAELASDETPGDLASGHAGTALLCNSLYEATGVPEWQNRSFKHLECASRRLFSMPDGLFAGKAGLLFAAELVAANSSGTLSSFRASVRDIISEFVQQHCVQEVPESVLIYDHIYGFSGILSAVVSSGNHMESGVVDKLVHYFDWLSSDLNGGRWHTLTPRSGGVGLFSNNLSVAHGLCGIILAFCAMRHELAKRVVRNCVDFLLRSQDMIDDKSWSPTVNLSADERKLQLNHSSGWCYGIVGLALTIASAASILDDVELMAHAHRYAAYTMSFDALVRLNGDNICHGLAGLVLCNRAIKDQLSGSFALDTAGLDLQTNLLLVKADSVCTEALKTTQVLGGGVGARGFLEGGVGIVMAALSTKASVRPQWTQALGIAKL